MHIDYDAARRVLARRDPIIRDLMRVRPFRAEDEGEVVV